MKKFFKILGYVGLSILVLLYISFLFILPKTINLNTYKPDIQKAVKDNTGLIIDFDKIDVITSPMLEAGIKTKNITLKLPDDTVLFSADSFKGKVFLPSLLWLSVRVSCADVESPKLNLEIIDSEKYKIAKVYEDLVNEKRAKKRAGEIIEENQESSFIDPSSIKLYIPSLKLKNYIAIIDDVKAGHKLSLKGNQIKIGYYNGKTAKLKADAKFYSDNDENITANLDIDSYIPVVSASKVEEDEDAVFELPFVNPVSTYRDYNLKSDISSKIKIRKDENTDKLWAKGNINIENTTVTLSGLELPKSYFRLKAKGLLYDIDSSLYATQDEYLTLSGKLFTGEKPYLDMQFISQKVHFNNLLDIAKAYLDTIHIKNDIANMTASGYLLSNFKLKTNFENIESNGKFLIRDGNIYDKNIGLLFNDINANLIFEDNIFDIKDTHLLINKKPLNVSGKIGIDSIADVKIYADKIPLQGLYKAFAPREIKNAYNLNSGLLSLDIKFSGHIKDAISLFKAELNDFNLSDNKGQFVVFDKTAKLGLATYSGVLKGKFKNNDFKFILPKTGSEIVDGLLIADFDNKDVVINESDIRLNKNSIIKLSGKVSEYLTNPDINIIADGNLATNDIKMLSGDALSPYLDAKGAIPLKATFESKKKDMKAVVQMQADKDSYITPVNFDVFSGNNVLLQLLAEKKGNNIKVYKSGLYLRKPGAEFKDKLSLNLLNAREIVGIRAMISNLNTKPFINLFKLYFKETLTGNISAFPKSKFMMSGSIYSYGEINNPKINGRFNIRDLTVPEWLVKIRDINADISNQNVKLNVRDVDANGSDFNIEILSTLNDLAQSKLLKVDVLSRFIDIDKIIKVSDLLVSSLPKSEGATVSGNADIPVEIRNGSINLRKIVTGNIVVDNTNARISLLKNVLHINRLKTSPLGGNVSGDIDVNLANIEIGAKLTGKDFNVEKVLADTMNMKDTLSGDMNFIADLFFKGTTTEEQMKSMKGYIDFSIKDGQLGPFGKFENFLMADNIRENAFFSSAIGSIITNIVTFDTSRYNSLFGHLTFENGFAKIAPIKTQGNVMSLYIAGDVGLLDNSADLILRGKLGSAFSDKLGPLANINPVNLVKNTPGLNIVLAKTFMVFCQAVSEEEMAAIPSLGKGKSDDYATKFQIKLKGDTRKPLKMIKSFKWLALNSEIESAKNFVDTIPVPEAGEENMSVEELIQLRQEQALEAKRVEEANKSVFSKIKNKFKRNK